MPLKVKKKRSGIQQRGTSVHRSKTCEKRRRKKDWLGSSSWLVSSRNPSLPDGEL
jgi:hypothetical protein